MKKLILLACAVFALTSIANYSSAQTKKMQTVKSNAVSTPSAVVAKLTRPVNDASKPVAKSRGDVYGSNYSDIIIANHTGYYMDIYVDGSYRGSIGAYDTKTTWAIPGVTTLYAKATFSDGSYKYWGPLTTVTGYAYTWSLY